jgi:hypothetical protein
MAKPSYGIGKLGVTAAQIKAFKARGETKKANSKSSTAKSSNKYSSSKKK